MKLTDTIKNAAAEVKASRDTGPKDAPLERQANRKERRDFVRAQHRLHRQAYGFGQWRTVPPGLFVTPARPRPKGML